MPTRRYRIKNKQSGELVEVSAPNFQWACYMMRWRMENCVGVTLGSQPRAPIKHYVKPDISTKERDNDTRPH